MVELRRVLIANRGEIAVRVIRACREASVEPIVAVTPDEPHGLPAALADGTVEVAGFLDADVLVRAARSCGADGVHPGYGFLSEDHAFATAVESAGLVWIGPPPEAMRTLGDKVSAREIATAAGIPVVPGITAEGRSPGELLDAAAGLGVPLLVKAAAGGGGRGMRTVDDPSDLAVALESARAEAVASFGDGRVFVERRLEGVRHVEVQVLVDAQGRAVHLGERDCSLQRRHQKIVEEAPSPSVDEALRARLGEAAIAIALHAGYRGAGTVEFLLDIEGRWWFLEMNARLQVEHGVTEMLTGVDLVRAQLELASGRPLRIDDGGPTMRGHAVEARVYAEDPAAGFVPAGGRVELLEFPHRPGVRIDSALRAGDEIGLGFDPLLAKVIALDEDRDAALTRLRSALADLRIVGVTTNLGFLLDVVDRPEVRAGTTDTDWVESRWTPRIPELPAGVHGGDPRDPWHAYGSGVADPGVTVAGIHAQYRGWSYRLEDDVAEADGRGSRGSSVAPMPATVRAVEVEVGQVVEAGQLLVLLEAMKIQVRVTSSAAGTVRAIHVSPGDVVARGGSLVEIEELP